MIDIINLFQIRFVEYSDGTAYMERFNIGEDGESILVDSRVLEFDEWMRLRDVIPEDGPKSMFVSPGKTDKAH